jgi:hypothetical protein
MQCRCPPQTLALTLRLALRSDGQLAQHTGGLVVKYIKLWLLDDSVTMPQMVSTS